MSRYILRAECATSSPFVDYLQEQTPGLIASDPTKLIVFVGDRMKTMPEISVMKCSGGLYVPQQFSWLNRTVLSTDPSKLFLDTSAITVTLAVDLEVNVDNGLQYGQPGTTIPAGSLAINLGNKGFQFNSTNLINGDEWGKLVYYEPGGLGVGWAFNANAYMPRLGIQSSPGLGMYMLGGLLPDVSYQSLVTQTGITNAQLVPSYNLQVGRDQALLTQMTSIAKVRGPQGYWSVQPNNLNSSVSVAGRIGGMIQSTTDTVTPTFSAYNPFGFMCLAFPTALQSSSQNTSQLGWNLLFPSYGLSTQDGYMLPCNCLSITPGAFFTDKGLELLQDPNSAPSSAPAVITKYWNEYWTNATNIIHLEETRPFTIEAPIFKAPVALNLIPNYENGLSMLVPVTRICNGVYLYIPIRSAVTGDVQAINMSSKTITNDPQYFGNPFGTLQKWFKPRRVSLTINIPVVRIDTALQASRFFGTPYFNQNYAIKTPVWIKFHFQPQVGPNGPVDPLSVDTTASLTQIAAASVNGVFNMVFTARTLLERFGTVLSTHGLPATKNAWGLSQLEISRIIVSCTTVPDLERIYRHLLGLPNFLTQPQGAIIRAGGMKMFSRCGPSLSAGAPNNMSVHFYDTIKTDLFTPDKVPELTIDVDDVLSSPDGTIRNDYFNSTSEFVFSRSVFLRLPDMQSLTDNGGQVDVTFSPRPILNMPFSGEVPKNAELGGPQYPNSSITSGVITTTNLSSYSQGWFNNLNPFSPDYNTQFNSGASQSTLDTYSSLDYKMVDFNRRKIEVWFELQVPVQIYTGTPFS